MYERVFLINVYAIILTFYKIVIHLTLKNTHIKVFRKMIPYCPRSFNRLPGYQWSFGVSHQKCNCIPNQLRCYTVNIELFGIYKTILISNYIIVQAYGMTSRHLINFMLTSIQKSSYTCPSYPVIWINLISKKKKRT